ncbi:darcynin family protein [Paraburkholderia sp. J41]|uniref:darcynin family protein n=1 Tax=Paraburkholderia sp. J41 TaxID=2805433 RepID=UPI0039F5B82E
MREHAEPLLAQYRDAVRLRACDVEFHATRVTDVAMWEAANHRAYERVADALRDTPFWDRLFDIVGILPGSATPTAGIERPPSGH